MSSHQLAIQKHIARQLNVCPEFETEEQLREECERRIDFLGRVLVSSGCTSLVLGISGGVDSLCAGLMAQRAVARLRSSQLLPTARFVAMRLPHARQADEEECTKCLTTIAPDELVTTDIAPAVLALATQIQPLEGAGARRDFLVGNVKARMRMVAQYAVAGAYRGLVLGTDHAAESVMGFFTKFGDGAADVCPLDGLVKSQVRAMARLMGAPEELVMKVPIADLEELRPGLTDEEAHGVEYKVIDAFLHLKPVGAEDFDKILNAYHNSAHKRSMPLTPSNQKL